MVPQAFSADSYSYDAANAALIKGNKYAQGGKKDEVEFTVKLWGIKK